MTYDNKKILQTITRSMKGATFTKHTWNPTFSLLLDIYKINQRKNANNTNA